MLTYEKVFEIFREYLAVDKEVEVIKKQPWLCESYLKKCKEEELE